MINGIRVAQDGKSVNSKDPEDYKYSSEFISPKVFLRQDGTVKVDATGFATFYIDHPLNYSPVCLMYYNPTMSIVNDSFDTSNAWGLADNNFVYVTSNKTNVRVDFQDCDANQIYKYIMYIFVEQAKNE